MNNQSPGALLERLGTGAWWPAYSAALRQLSLADDEAAAIVAIRDAVVALGGNGAIYSQAIRHDAALTLVRTLVVGDAAWTHLYSTSDWCEADPWIAHASRFAMPALAQEIELTDARQRDIVDALSRHGFASALVVPSPSNFGLSRIGMLCIGAAQNAHFEGPAFALLRPLARGLAMEVSDWCLRRMRAELIRSAQITSQDLSLLRHEVLGHSSKLIAIDLHTTPSTIDSRFHRLSHRLGVATRRDAVRLGRLYGLI
jgi:DNA-binding CsgD family transcriptional regulator